MSSMKAEYLNFFRAWQKALAVTLLSAISDLLMALKKLSRSFCMDDFNRFMRNNAIMLKGRVRFLLKSLDDLLWREMKSFDMMIFLIKSNRLAHNSHSNVTANFDCILTLMRHFFPPKIIRLTKHTMRNIILLLYSFSFILQYISSLFGDNSPEKLIVSFP